MKKRIIFGLVLCALLSVMGTYTIKDVKAASSDYTTEQIKNYIEKEEAPTESGKIFAGWYNDTTPVKSSGDVNDTTVPKFVDEEVLTVVSQLKMDSNDANNIHVRFLTSVDSLNYRSVQFELALEGSNKVVTKSVSKVYTSVTAEGEKFTPKEVFSEESYRIAMVLLTDFTKDSTESDEYGYWGKTITVTPKWTTMDGTTVTGKTRQIEVNDGLYDTEVNSGSSRTWHDLKEGIQAVNASTEDVTIDLLRNVTYKGQIGINVAQNPNGTVTINGNGYTLTGDFEGVDDAHFIKFANRFGTIIFNNITINHKNTVNNLIAFGNSTPIDLTETMVVNFKDVTINSESTNAYSLINAIQVTNFDIALDHVTLNWKTESEANAARAAIRYGDVGQDKAVNLVIKNESILNMSEAVGSGIVYATTGFNANTAIAVLDSEIIPYAGQYAYKGNSGDFQAVAYTAGRAYMALDAAVSAANASEEDVTLILLKDVKIASDLSIKNANGKKFVLDGNGNTATVTRPIFIYQDKGLAEVKNLKVTQTGGNPLFRIGNKDATYSEKVTVNLTDITVDSEGTCQSGLIQAGYATMSLDVNMTNVIVDWDNTTKSITTGAIVAGKSDKTTTLNLTMTDCNIDASGSQDATGIYTESTVKGNLILKKTSITSYTGKDAVVDQNMKFARNTASVLSTYPAKQVQVGDFIYNEFTEGVADANASEEDVTIKLLSEVDIASDHLKIQNVNNKNIVWDGNGFTAYISKAIFIYQKAGSVDVKNMIIKQSNGNPLFRIGELNGTYPTSAEEVFTVNLTDLDIDAEGPCTSGLIQAGYGSMEVAVNMKNVDFAWETTNTNAKNIIVAGADNKTTVLDLNIEKCTFDTTNVSATKAIHAKDGVTGTITFKNSTVKTKEADVIRLGNMDLAIDTATAFWQGETQSVALVDGVQKSDFYAAVTLVNSATANTRMDIVNNFTHDNSSGVTINNANGNDVLVDAHGHTADVRRAILIYQKSGLMDIRNLVVVQTGGNPLFRIGELNGTYPTSEEVFTVNLTNLDIDSEGTAGALIQAGYGSMEVAVNMKNVDFAWTKSNTNAKNIIVAGADNKTTVLDLNIEKCTFDTANVSATKAIHVKDGVTGTITFKNSTVKTKEADVIRLGNMDLAIDTATAFWQGETQSVALVDGVQKSDFYAAVTLVNSATANTRMDIVNNFIHDNSSGVTINNANGNDVLVDGHGHTADVRRAILIYQKSGLMDIKNLVIVQSGGNPLFRIGELNGTYPTSTEEVFTVNLTDLDIDSEGTAGALIQAGYGSMKVAVNMKNVDFAWTKSNTSAKNIIVAGADNKTTVLDLNIENCTFDTTNVSTTKAIHAKDGVTGTITFKNSTVKTKEADVIQRGNMDLVIDTATTFWQGEIQSAAFIDGVQYTQLADAVVAANQSEEDVTIIFVSDEVTFANTTIDINNALGKSITIDGRNKNLCPDDAAIRIYQKSGLVEVKNMVVPNLEKNILFRIGDRGATYSSTDKLTVNLKNLEIASTSNQKKGLIQAGYGPMNLDLNMTDVNLTWAPTQTHEKGAITVGCADISATATVNLTMTNCTINTSRASKGHALYVENNATGTIQLNNTSLIAADGQTVYNNNIPVYDTDKVTTVLFKDSKFYEVRIEGADATDLTTYATSLEEQGYTKHSEKTIGNAEYAVFTNDEIALYINQFDSAMRIKSDDKETAFLPTAEQSNFTKVCDTKGYMVGVTADTTDIIAIENGMCFIYLLADGTFLVYDGGRNEDDANHLYALLQSIAAENNIQNIVISNWIVTHAHGDHTGCMETFFSVYASKVTIERVMLNRTHVSLGTGVSESMEKNVVKTVNTYSADTEIVRLHSGQEFYLADVKVEVLYTVEDLAPGTLTDYNAASTITRLTIGGKTILMTGDASFSTWELMCETYGEALKSDYLQVPHHGAHDGGTTAAYDLIKPTYLLWPCGELLYEMNLTIWNKDYAVNKYLLTLVESGNSYIAGVYDATNNKECITEFPVSE